ncbi:MAG TPA: VOC family protein [Pyrinomonadaceae bacterium]|nr:VOC family protein [Pyrinomonadaceae bacterium]
MSIGIVDVSHVNVTVPSELEERAKQFYGELLGLRQIPKPPGPRQFVGAWYQIGATQLHLSIENDVQNSASKRHVCYFVEDLGVAAERLRGAGFEIIRERDDPDESSRFFVRDPGGNMIEIAQSR